MSAGDTAGFRGQVPRPAAIVKERGHQINVVRLSLEQKERTLRARGSRADDAAMRAHSSSRDPLCASQCRVHPRLLPRRARRRTSVRDPGLTGVECGQPAVMRRVTSPSAMAHSNPPAQPFTRPTDFQARLPYDSTLSRDLPARDSGRVTSDPRYYLSPPTTARLVVRLAFLERVRTGTPMRSYP